MQDSDEPKLGLKFSEVPYTIETGEAEFIGVDFVARGGGNATAVDSAVKTKSGTTTETSKAEGGGEKSEKGKGKGKAKKEEVLVEEHQTLSREDEEAIASLTAKANAIKMLHARINLISTYLLNLSSQDSSNSAPPNHEILRSIQALLSRLTLLIPANSTGFSQELISEQNDVNLVRLLNSITQSVKDARELGKKFSIIDSQKNMKNKNGGGGGGWDINSGDSRGFGGNGVMGVGDLLT
jgi:COP9 signalosome complex subunit 6